MWPISSMRGLTIRQPRVESNTSAPRWCATSAFGITNGARVIDSTPPAMTRSALPVSMSIAAYAVACIPDPHSRLIVTPGTDSGSPASRRAIRATLRLSSPAWFVEP